MLRALRRWVQVVEEVLRGLQGDDAGAWLDQGTEHPHRLALSVRLDRLADTRSRLAQGFADRNLQVKPASDTGRSPGKDLAPTDRWVVGLSVPVLWVRFASCCRPAGAHHRERDRLVAVCGLRVPLRRQAGSPGVRAYALWHCPGALRCSRRLWQ